LLCGLGLNRPCIDKGVILWLFQKQLLPVIKTTKGGDVMTKYVENQNHDDIPGEALEEERDQSAGKTVQWTVIIAVAVLLIIFLLFFAKYMK